MFGRYRFLPRKPRFVGNVFFKMNIHSGKPRFNWSGIKEASKLASLSYRNLVPKQRSLVPDLGFSYSLVPGLFAGKDYRSFFGFWLL